MQIQCDTYFSRFAKRTFRMFRKFLQIVFTWFWILTQEYLTLFMFDKFSFRHCWYWRKNSCTMFLGAWARQRLPFYDYRTYRENPVMKQRILEMNSLNILPQLVKLHGNIITLNYWLRSSIIFFILVNVLNRYFCTLFYFNE